jgi:ATP-dependent phosphofructokinase / diphosphate-dependent phosphofructokinase
MAKKRIGILTGGGDVPGLNAVIKSVTYRGSENDIEVVHLRRGWEGLTHLRPRNQDVGPHRPGAGEPLGA